MLVGSTRQGLSSSELKLHALGYFNALILL